ncbi:MAG: hypothetical protein RIR47_119 [Bacteroidota bacterium]|jgi:ABC-type multidrug transport system fused ATPase/permease subunit
MVYLWFILFLISLVLNGILAWYIRKLINQFKDAIGSVSDLQSLMEEYLGHIKMISEMETYYGDVTIENLLKHTKDMVDNLKLAGDRFSLLETQEGEDNETKE